MDATAHSAERSSRAASDDMTIARRRLEYGSRQGRTLLDEAPARTSASDVRQAAQQPRETRDGRVIERSDGSRKGAKVRVLSRSGRRRQQHECKVFTEPVLCSGG